MVKKSLGMWLTKGVGVETILGYWMSCPNLQSPQDERGGSGLIIRAMQVCKMPAVEAGSEGRGRA